MFKKQWISRFLVLLMLASPVSVLAAEPAKAEASKGALVITSDQLDMSDQQQSAIFSGHVLAEDGAMRLSADRMIVFYHATKKGVGPMGRIHQIRAEGQVILEQNQHRGTADVALYRVGPRTLELIGKENNAVVQQGEDRLEGKNMVLTMGANQEIRRVSVSGGSSQRVKARITSKEGEKFGLLPERGAEAPANE
ncbi:MAG: LptA/OstA family protein [Magnetococcales bacterium]|nr:LptA/OstA family protein [Magnetococcales bacterium]